MGVGGAKRGDKLEINRTEDFKILLSCEDRKTRTAWKKYIHKTAILLGSWILNGTNG